MGSMSHVVSCAFEDDNVIVAINLRLHFSFILYTVVKIQVSILLR